MSSTFKWLGRNINSFHKIIDLFRLEGPLWGHLIPLPCSSKVSQSRLPRRTHQGLSVSCLCRYRIFRRISRKYLCPALSLWHALTCCYLFLLLQRLFPQSWQTLGMKPRRQQMTWSTLRTCAWAETSTRPSVRFVRVTPSSASMSLSPCKLSPAPAALHSLLPSFPSSPIIHS